MRHLLILTALTLSNACISEPQNIQFVLHLPTGYISYEEDAPENYSGSDTVHVFPDTIYTIFERDSDLYYVIEAGEGSDLGGIFFIHESSGKRHVPLHVLDPMGILSIIIEVIDLDDHEPPEIVSAWIHEGDTYFVRIDRILPDKSVEKAFSTDDLGVPWVGDGRPFIVTNDSLFLQYMLEDGSGHERALVEFENGNFSLKKVP